MSYINDIVVVVCTCKKYEDVSQMFQNNVAQMFFNNGLSLFYLSDYYLPEIDKNNQIIVNESSWSKRISKSLQLIDSKYVLFLLDDYFYSDPKIVNFILNYDKNYDYYRVVNIPDTKRNMNINDNYTINLQPAIWNKKTLQDILYAIDSNPWKTEVSLNDFFKNNNYSYAYEHVTNYNNGVIKGEFARDLIFDIPKRSERKSMSFVSWKKYKLKCFLSSNLGPLKPILKSLLKKFNFSFYSG